MILYLLRHGMADWPEWQGPDDDRPLTKKGRKQVKKAAKGMAHHGVAPAAILSSPLPRAMQTAETAGEALGVQVVTDPILAPGFEISGLPELLQRYPGQDLMLVGHDPDFTHAVQALTGARAVFPKAGLVRIDLEDPNILQGELVYLVPPKIMKR